MRFKQIIQEEASPRGEQTTMERAAELIMKNCSAAANHLVKNNRCIYRGVDAAKNSVAFIGDTSKTGPRKSANTHNYYTLTIDNSEQWASYPKRGYSFICSTDESYTSSYGEVFMAFPVNGTKIGICSDNDMWESFISILDNGIVGLNDDISFFLKMSECIEDHKAYADLSISGWRPPDNSIEEFKRALNRCEQVLSDNNIQTPKQFFEAAVKTGSVMRGWWKDQAEQLSEMITAGQRHNGIINWYKNVIAPEKNGFKLATIEQFSFPPQREVWFSGVGIFVNFAYLDDLRYLLANQNI
jgi:hypothetical protein